MLIRFNVKNFLSFSAREDGKSEEFSMLAGKMRSKEAHILATDKIKLLKFSAIYGANAAGKSNLVKAMSFMQQAVVRRLSERFADKYCKNDAANKDKPSYFEMEIMLGEHYYAYGFEVILSRLQFVSEWLFLLDVDQDELIFERNITAGTYELGECFKKNAKLHEKLDIYAGDIRDDGSTLFLRVMNQNKKNFYQENGDAQVLRQIYSWIKAGLDITYPDQPVSDYSYLTASNDVGELCRVISAFGTGITDFKILDVPIERVVSKLPLPLREKIESTIEEGCRQVKRENEIASIDMVMRSNKDFFIIKIGEDEISCQTIKFCHENEGMLFSLAEESDGTVRLLDLLEILLAGEGRTYVLDELDRCLHPSLTYTFVETFLKLAEKKNIQLIVTTHESRLLDFNLLRRDEVWFVNKRADGASNLYSLEEYNERFDKKIDRAYLEGRYGGVPIFNAVFPFKEE